MWIEGLICYTKRSVTSTSLTYEARNYVVMGRKHKRENSSPSASQKPKIVISVRAKANMVTPNTPISTGTADNGARNTGISPTQVGQGVINTGVQFFCNQGGQSSQGYILPPVNKYPQQFMMKACT